MKPMNTRTLVTLALLALCSGCAMNGPKQLSLDRIDYGAAISGSWKEQMLLNIVRLRYGDAPVFLDPTSVISQYATIYDGSVAISGSTPVPPSLWMPPGPGAPNIGGTVVGRNYIENRPTVTYAPLTGDRFARSMLTPMQPHVVVSLAQAGYPLEVVFRVMLFSLNGLKNERAAGMMMCEPDPRFVKLVKAMGELQRKGSVGTRLERREKGDVPILTIQQEGDVPGLTEVRELLGVDADATELPVVYGNKKMTKNELALQTRSLNDMLFEFAAYIEVPEKDVAEGRALPAIKLSAELEKIWPTLIKIHSGEEQPADVLVATKYRNQWFYISDTDIMSKRMFSFMMFLITLAETSGGPASAAPQVTVPVR
jgi:hypothetical protein